MSYEDWAQAQIAAIVEYFGLGDVGDTSVVDIG